ncbi:hypothetical protein [Sulfurimonas sp. HSL3-7]|uniref:hypothetical protein n=1 Tax=Sulfonitrofixus jiaomeiensis TaxID=3131938 RepID=UPI0031F8A7F8
MATKNTELSESLQKSIDLMADYQAYALGINRDTPFFALKLPQNFAPDLDEPLSCEFKPAMLNVTYHGQTFALCVVQFRLNGRDSLVCSLNLDLMQDREHAVARALLRMQEYGVMLVTEELHRAMEFKANFVGTFNPIVVLEETVQQADSDDKALCREVYSGIASQFESASDMWYSFESIAPAHHRWYAKM